MTSGPPCAGGSTDSVSECSACASRERHVFAGDIFDHINAHGADRRLVYRCECCRSLYLSLRPSQEAPPAVYASYDTHSLIGDHEPRPQARATLVTPLVDGYLNHHFGSVFAPTDWLGVRIFMLWMAWPNPGGLGARTYGPAWRGPEVLRQLCISLRRAMETLLAPAGFMNIQLMRRGHHGQATLLESSGIAIRRAGRLNRIHASLAQLTVLLMSVGAACGGNAVEEPVLVGFAARSDK